MKLQGNVNGYIYPVDQQSVEEPINATRRCNYCGRKFAYDPETRLKSYCSHECKRQEHTARVRASRNRSKFI